MALLVGAFLALTVGLLATAVGLDRDRAFYPTVTMVIASYYALFAVMGASAHALVLESLVGAVFLAVALAGYRWSLWVVVAALVVHGVFDLAFCLTYDVTAATYLAWLLRNGRTHAAS